jgi:hypothetical protein
MANFFRSLFGKKETPAPQPPQEPQKPRERAGEQEQAQSTTAQQNTAANAKEEPIITNPEPTPIRTTYHNITANH